MVLFRCLIALVSLALISCATTPDTSRDTAPAPVAASTPAPKPTEPALPLWPEVTHGTLPNGLQYYVLKHEKPEKRAFIWLAVNAGSMVEDDDQRGLAHFDEHMAFNGTEKYPKAEIIGSLEKMGMRFGADLNAYTNYDETVYQLEVPTDVPANLEKGLDILHQWAAQVSYEAAEIDKERGVVLEELRLRKGVMERVFDKHLQVELGDTRYAKRKPIGLASTLEKAPREVLKRFYDDWYRPDLMAVIVVGDVDPKAVEKQVAAMFGDIKSPASPRVKPMGGVPKADGTRVSIEADPELPFTAVQVTNVVPHRAEVTPRDFRRILTEQLYAAMFNERMSVVSRRADAPFSGAGAQVSALNRETDTLVRGASVKGGKIEEALKLLLTESLRIEKIGFTQKELDRALANITRSYVQLEVEASTADSRLWAGEITRHFFEREFMVGQAEEKRLALEILPKITLDEVNTTASRFGGADNRVVLVSGPEASKLPTREKILDLVKTAESQTLDAWKEKEGVNTLLTEPPKPGSIVKETVNPKVGSTEWVLSNGARVIVKTTDFAADSVSMRAVSPGGMSLAPDKDFSDLRFTNDLVAVGGVGQVDIESLSKLLTGKHLSVHTSIDPTTESLSGNSSLADLQTFFQLIYMKMARPRRDDAMIALAKSNSIEQLTEIQRSPQFQFSVKFQDVLTSGHPRAKVPSAADLERADIDKMFAFFNDRFGDASDFIFTFVGAATAEQLKPLVEKYIASLPGKGRKEKERDVGVKLVKGVVKKQWALEKEPKTQVTLFFHGDEKWSRDKQRDLFILGQVLSIRLRELLREDMGGVYGVSAHGSLTRSPQQQRAFTISFTCDPTRADALVKATFDEISKIAKDGIGDEYLGKVKATFMRERETELRTNGFWLQQLSSSAYYNDDPAIVLDPSQVTARMTSPNVKAAASKFLDPKQYFDAELLPAPAQ